MALLKQKRGMGRGSLREKRQMSWKDQGHWVDLASMLKIPPDAVVETGPCTAKNVKGTTDRQIDLPIAAVFDEVQIAEPSPSAGIGDGYGAPHCQLRDQLLVDASL